MEDPLEMPTWIHQQAATAADPRRPSEEVRVHNQPEYDDTTSVITDMLTIDYDMQNSMYPSAADVLHMADDSDEEHPNFSSSNTSTPLKQASTKGTYPSSLQQPQEVDAIINVKTQNSIPPKKQEKSKVPTTQVPTQSSSQPASNNTSSNTLLYDTRGRILKSNLQSQGLSAGAFAVDGPNFPQREDNDNTDNYAKESELGGIAEADESANETTKTHKSASTTPWWRRTKYILRAFGAFVVLLTAVAVLVVLLSGGSTGNQDEISPEEVGEGGVDVKTLVPNLTDSTLLDLEDPFSVQYLAFDWITRDADWESYEDWRKQQRFATACLVHAFGGAASSVAANTNSYLLWASIHSHECNWDAYTDLCPEEDGTVRTLIDHRRHGRQKGFLPPEIAFLSNLDVLDFYQAWWTLPLEDMLPKGTTANLPILRELKIVDSELQGTIPSSLGLLTSLQHLDLSNNKLTSTIPSELGLLSNLHTLVLSSNNLSGSLPKELGGLSSLTTFDVRDNPAIEEALPLGFCKKDGILWESLETDWCSGHARCCTGNG